MFSRLSSRMRLQCPLAPMVVALAVAGCGSKPSAGTGPIISTVAPTATTSASAPGSTTGATLAPPTSRGPFADAGAEVKKLLALAKPGTRITPQGTVPGWAPANGSAIPATPTDLSGFGFVPDKAKSMQYLSFAIKDTSGRCAGGDLQANSAGTRVTGGRAITVPAKASCTGEEVAKVAGHS